MCAGRSFSRRLAHRQPAAKAADPIGAKVWLGYYAEYEEYLKTAAIQKIDDIPIGEGVPGAITPVPRRGARRCGPNCSKIAACSACSTTWT